MCCLFRCACVVYSICVSSMTLERLSGNKREMCWMFFPNAVLCCSVLYLDVLYGALLADTRVSSSASLNPTSRRYALRGMLRPTPGLSTSAVAIEAAEETLCGISPHSYSHRYSTTASSLGRTRAGVCTSGIPQTLADMGLAVLILILMTNQLFVAVNSRQHTGTTLYPDMPDAHERSWGECSLSGFTNQTA